MHPHHEHRAHKVEKRRVHHITKGYASGGAVHHDDAPEDMKSIRKANAKRDAMAVSGRPAKQRADRPCRARGGRAGKHKGTNVNVIVAPHGGAPAAAPAAPPMPVAAPAPPVARPPVPPMQGMPPPGAVPPGMPGAMPPRHAGGRTYAQGGRVKDGPAWKEGMRAGTPVQHTNNKLDGKNVGRGRVVTFRSGGRVVSFRTGGAVEAPKTGVLTPHLPAGAGGGEARLVKMRRAEKNYKRA